MNFKKLVENILAPPVCVFCKKELYVTSNYCVCRNCADIIPYNDGKRCRICSTPLDISYGDLYCLHCKRTKRSFNQNISRYIYKDGVAEAIKQMKFGQQQLWIAKALGAFLAQTIKENYGDILFDMVIPVPLSKRGLRERGFNQSEVIAEEVCRNTGLFMNKNILLKSVDTPKQSSLNFKNRKQNVKGVFKLRNSELAADKTVLIIDDIFTTGATFNECAKILKKAGALTVFCAAVAATELHR
ncbi:MAG: ComF family protein [Firmicutes bacterium]|nr:ComF family protein [Bacillota bacterium]